MSTILLIAAIVLVLGALPAWPYSSDRGYYPSLTLIALAIIAVFVMPRRT
jgi:hypothetical protein